MAISIEKFKVESRIAVCLYKHRGIVEAVAAELNVDASYVKRVADKLKKKRRRDVGFNVAIMIMETIYMGYEQRVAHLNECINKLRHVEEADVSICCNAITKEEEEGGQQIIRCLKCKNTTHIHHIHKPQIYKLIQEFGQELREEDKHLLEFADKMGFTLKDPVPQNLYRQNIVVVGDPNQAKRLPSDQDRTIVKEIEQMDPMERQRMRKRLEQAIEEGDITD